MNGLLGLFASAFVAATLFPGGSEVLLAALAMDGRHPGWQLIAVATLGNTAGAMTSYAVGWWIARRWPARELVKAGHQRALARVQRHGRPLLLLSWLPIGGDALCVAAGWLRLGWRSALVYIAAGKLLRYVGVYLLAAQFASPGGGGGG